MATDDLLLDPHHVKGDDDWWWYEESGGICIVTRDVGVLGTIPWRSVRAALKRFDRDD